eukprot:5355737-Pyramimonas_sp.AAC.2
MYVEPTLVKPTRLVLFIPPVCVPPFCASLVFTDVGSVLYLRYYTQANDRSIVTLAQVACPYRHPLYDRIAQVLGAVVLLSMGVVCLLVALVNALTISISCARRYWGRWCCSPWAWCASCWRWSTR